MSVPLKSTNPNVHAYRRRWFELRGTPPNDPARVLCVSEYEGPRAFERAEAALENVGKYYVNPHVVSCYLVSIAQEVKADAKPIDKFHQWVERITTGL